MSWPMREAPMREAPMREAMADLGGMLRISLIGRHAARCLAALGRRPGTVLAAFERSFYLCDDRTGDLACLGPMGIGAGPLNALAANWPAVRVRQGERVTPTGNGCRLESGIVIEASAARCHEPAMGPFLETGAALARLAARAVGFARTDGLAPLVIGREAAPSALITHALSGIDPLTAWLRGGDSGAPPPVPAIDRLLGLGPGLTPSGDDFLGGMMIALFASGRTETARRLADAVMPRAGRATGRISLAHLAAAAEGEGAGALHDVLAALDRADEAALDAALAAIDRIGHSSGWDALAGAAAALAAQPDSSAAAISAASALDAATSTPAARKTPI